MKKTLLSGLMAIAAVAASAQYPYKVIAPLPVENGTVAYLTNYDTGQVTDSTVIADNTAVFVGELDEPFAVRLTAGGNRFGTFILEQGTTAVNQTTRKAVGSMLNDAFNAINDSLEAIVAKYDKASTVAERKAVIDKFMSATEEAIADNIDNPISLLLFTDYSAMAPVEDVVAFIDQYPDLKQYRRVQNMMESAQHKLATSAGKPMVDFEVEYDGKVQKLSDYVLPGKYTLVDFWASWCGPCIREIRTLKELYAQYHDKGLNIVGVAVWDEPENTLQAIKSLDIPWPCIINSQTIATDIYGIPAIPCIMLISPDGIIVARDVVGAELKEIVANAIGQ